MSKCVVIDLLPFQIQRDYIARELEIPDSTVQRINGTWCAYGKEIHGEVSVKASEAIYEPLNF